MTISRLLFTLLLLQSTCFAHNKTIAITIDDLPFVGEARNFHLNMLIETMKERHVPATGFIIGSEVRKDNWETLRKFRDAGFGVGNHTHTHINLNRVKTKRYIHDINQADTLLAPILTEPKYFRYPYLAMSNGRKRDKILCHLRKKHYQVAPITIDSKDFFFNQRLLSTPEIDRRNYLAAMKPFYLEFIWQQTQNAEEHNQINKNSDQAQILLIHANLLNAYVLPDIIRLYKQKGYEFVTLEDALKTFKGQAHCLKPIEETILTEPSKDPVQTIDEFVEWD